MGSQSVWVWLGPVLAFAGPVLAFAGAMIALWITNMRADRHEWNKWRRDTLIKLCADATESSRLVEVNCMHSIQDEIYESASKRWEKVDVLIDRVALAADQLRLVGAHSLAEACSELEGALIKASESTIKFYAIKVNVKVQAELCAEDGKQLDASYYKQETSMASQHVGLMAKIDPARAKLIRQGEIELNLLPHFKMRG